jgi:hypothetical protein
MNNICVNSCSREEIGSPHLSITHSMSHMYLHQKITLHGLTWTTTSSLGRRQLVDGDTILLPTEKYGIKKSLCNPTPGTAEAILKLMSCLFVEPYITLLTFVTMC